MPNITQKLGFDASDAVRSLDALTTRMNTASTAAEKFNRTVGKRINTAPLDKARDKANQFTVSWETMARVVQTQIAIRALNRILAGLSEGIDLAQELGLAIKEIQTISGRALSDTQLTDQVLALSDALADPAADVAEGLYQTISNQVVEAGESFNFLSDAIRLARITGAEGAEAVNAMSSVMNSYGYEAERAGHVSDTLFKMVELGRLRLGDIANVIGRVTPLTAEMGVEWEEAGAAIAVMTRQGVRADTAITQLRAIMTKIIRPTQEMRDIFRSWGVEDGKQAVETFGGLNGVLRKLAEETGGSSSEMADLLRRVRTIVGQLSLMRDGGEALTEAMNELKNSTGEVSNQWDQFTESDAFRLEQEVNQLTNTMIRLGSSVLPAIRVSMQAINDTIEQWRLGFMTILNLWDEAAVQNEIFRRLAKNTQEEIDQINSWFSERQEKRYEGLKEAALQYYASARSEEFKYAEIRDKSIERASQVLKDQGKDISKFYKDTTKDLKSFVDEINDKIKSNTDKIADIGKEIRERQIDAELDKYEDNYKKIRVLDQELAKQRTKAFDAFRKIDATEGSRDRALAENEIAIDLAKQAKSLAKAEGHRATIANWEGRIQSLLKQRQNILEVSNQRMEEAQQPAEDLYKELSEGEKQLEKLIQQRTELYASGRLNSRNEKQRQAAEAVLEDINSKISALMSDASRADEFLQSLGLESNMTKVTDGVTQALNEAHKDWEAEVARAEAAFSKANLAVRVALDPGGTRAKAAETLGVEKGEGETEAGFFGRVDDTALKTAREYESLQNRMSNVRTKINDGLSLTNNHLEQGQALLDRQIGTSQTYATMMSRLRHTVLTPFISAQERQKRVSEDLNQDLQRSLGNAPKVTEEIRNAVAAVREGEGVTKDQISTWREQVEAVRGLNRDTSAWGYKMDAVLDALQLQLQNAEALKNIMEDMPSTQEYEAAREIKSLLGDTKREIEEGTNVQENFNNSLENAKGAIKDLEEGAKGMTPPLNDSAKAAGATANITASLGAKAIQQVAAIDSLAAAYDRLAKSAQRANASGASAGVAATAFHGGPMARFFAAGGLARGQDRILTALSSGETVINSRNSRRFFSELNAMNQGSQPVYREQGGSVTNVGDVNVTVQGGDSSQQTVREIGHALRREFQRGNIKLR